MNLPTQTSFAERVSEAERTIADASFAVARLANRLCGHVPESAGEGAMPPRSDAVFDQTRESAAAIIRSANSIMQNVARVEASLPPQEIAEAQYDSRHEGKAYAGTTAYKGL